MWSSKMDLLFLGLVALLFAGTVALAALCERL